MSRRVFVEDLRQDGTYLRVTWHPEFDAFVVSHWNGTVCQAATRVAVADAPAIVSLLATGLGEAASKPSPMRDETTPKPTLLARLKAALRGHESAAEVIPLRPTEATVFDEPGWASDPASSTPS